MVWTGYMDCGSPTIKTLANSTTIVIIKITTTNHGLFNFKIWSESIQVDPMLNRIKCMFGQVNFNSACFDWWTF